MPTKWEPPNKPYVRQPWTPRNSFSHRSSERPIIDITPPKEAAAPLAPLTPQRLSLDQIRFQRYSHIIAWKIVEYKLIPNALTDTSDAPMDWYFEERIEDHDNEVRVYVSLSPEDVDIIRRKGYQHYILEKKVKVFDAPDLAALEELQQRELDSASSPAAQAFLRLEHKQQLEWATEQEYELTILDYLAAPFRRNFSDRYQATLGERHINGRLSEFKTMLSKHYGE